MENQNATFTENQIKAIDRFAFARDSMTVMRELNELYRSWLVDPERRELFIEEDNAAENRDRAFLIEELVALVHDLYE